MASTHAVVFVDLVVVELYCLALVVAEIVAVIGLAAGDWARLNFAVLLAPLLKL